MGVINQIEQMKAQGIPEEEIARQLRQRGVSPKEIVDALNQIQVKNSVSTQNEMMNAPPVNDEFPQEEMPTIEEQPDYYSPSIQETPAPQKNYYTPSPREEAMQMPQGEQQEYYEQQPAEQDYSGGFSTDTIIEIAEQIFSEKSQELQKQIKNLNEFSSLAQIKISETSDRLKRIESMIDKLQISILDKVSSYGNNLESVKKEMTMMQDSFSKALNPILDKSEKTISKKKK